MKASKRTTRWTGLLAVGLLLGVADAEARWRPRPLPTHTAQRPNGSTVTHSPGSIGVATVATVEATDGGNDWTVCHGSYRGNPWYGLGRTNEQGIWEAATVYTGGDYAGCRTRYFGNAKRGVSLVWSADGTFQARYFAIYRPHHVTWSDQENPRGLTCPTDEEVGLNIGSSD